MITQLLLDAVIGVVTALTALVPWDVTIDSAAMEQGIDGFWDGAAGWNNWLPVVHMLASFVLLFGAGVSVTMYRFARDLWDALPLT